jgi:hypothetical protein
MQNNNWVINLLKNITLNNCLVIFGRALPHIAHSLAVAALPLFADTKSQLGFFLEFFLFSDIFFFFLYFL